MWCSKFPSFSHDFRVRPSFIQSRYGPSSARIPASNVPLANGTRFGRYQILTALDAGGTGNVYRVWDIPLDRTLAFKVLAPTMAATTGVSVRHAGAPV